MRGFVEFGGGGQGAVVVNNVLFSIVDVLQIVLFEEDKTVFRSFQVIGAGEFAGNGIGACLRQCCDRNAAAGSEASLVVTLYVGTLNDLIVPFVDCVRPNDFISPATWRSSGLLVPWAEIER